MKIYIVPKIYNKKGVIVGMEQRKKKPDKLIAGFLALLTAFSPVASVVPVYASGMDSDSTGSSITMDPDSITVDETGSDGIVLDNTDDGADGIKVVGDDDENGSDGITIDDGPSQGDGIDIDEPSDVDDGIDIEESDGIEIDPMDIEILDLYDDDEDVYDSVLREIDFDIRSVHGYIEISSEDDSFESKIVRVTESDEGYRVLVTDLDSNILYDELLVSTDGLPWSEFVSSDKKYTVNVVADEGYVISSFDVVNIFDGSNDVVDFTSNVYSSYMFDFYTDRDKSIVVNFALEGEENISDESQVGYDDLSIFGVKDVIESDFLDKDDSDIESVDVCVETEADVLGSDSIFTFDSMVDEVDVPDIDAQDVKSSICDPIYEGYIQDNLDQSYVTYDDITPAAAIVLKQTFLDQNVLNGRSSISELMFADDAREVVIGQMDTIIPMYDVNSNSDYYVGYVDTMHNDSRSYVLDYEFAFNNLDGEVLSGCHYDYDTGIAYVPKSYFFDDDNNVLLDKVQIQLGQAIDYNSNYVESVILDSESTDVFVDSFDIFTGSCQFYVESGLDQEHMNVYVNGAPSVFDYSYDSSSGLLTINGSSALISSVRVEDTRDLFTTVMNCIFPVTIAHAVTDKQMETFGEVSLKNGVSDVNVGTGGKEKGTYYYISSSSKSMAFSNYSHTCYTFKAGSVGAIDSVSSRWFNWIKSGNSGNVPSPLNFEETRNGMFFCVDLDSLSDNNLPIEFDNLLTSGNKTLIVPFMCSHIGEQAQGGKLTTINGYPAVKDGNVYCRIISKYNDTVGGKKRTYITIGICTGTMFTQTGIGLIKVYYEDNGPTSKKIKLEKELTRSYAETFNTDGLESYDMVGTWFGVYKTEEQALNATTITNPDTSVSDLDKVGQNGCLKILKVKNSDGKTGTWSLKKDPGDSFWRDSAGTKVPDKVYVTEIKAGAGYKIARKQDGVTPLVLEIDLNKIDGDDLKFGNVPLRDPQPLTIFKMHQGDPEISTLGELSKKITPDMNGAEFKLEYWGVTPQKGSDNYKSHVEAVINGEKYDSGEAGAGDDPLYEGDRITGVIEREPNATVVLKSRYDKVKSGGVDYWTNGVIQLCEEGIVSGSWPYVWSHEGKSAMVMPIGIYRLTEIKAPEGYELPLNNVFLGVCTQSYSDSQKNFTATFKWLLDSKDVIEKSEIKVDREVGAIGYESKTYVMTENPKYVNIGILKIDKDTGKPGKPNNDALSLEGIEFEVVYDVSNTEKIVNKITGKEVEPGQVIEGVKLVTDENGCADTVGLNMLNGQDMGVLPPGHTYLLREVKGNDSFVLSESVYSFTIPLDMPDEWRPEDGSPVCAFPTKDGNVVAHKDITCAADVLKDENKDKLDINSILWIENTSPNIGIGVQKYDVMLDQSELGANGKDTQGNADLSGHTFVVLNGTKSEIRLHDKKTEDGKGTKIKSIWAHGDHWKSCTIDGCVC